MKQNGNIIKKPRIYLYVGLPSLIFWIILFVWCILAKEDLEYDSPIVPFILCGPFIVGFIYLCLLGLNWKIIFGKDKVIIYNFLRRKKIYDINELTVFNKSPNKKGAVKFYIYYNSKRIVVVSMFDENFELITKIKTDLSKFI